MYAKILTEESNNIQEHHVRSENYIKICIVNAKEKHEIE